MHFIGNDIVDLETAQARGKSSNFRFIDRVLTDREKELLLSGTEGERDTLLWTMWAAKEAAYKVSSKIFLEVPAKCRAYEVTLADKHEGDHLLGTVSTPLGLTSFSIERTSSHIHCVASNAERIVRNAEIAEVREKPSYVESLKNGESRFVRLCVKRGIGSYLGLDPNDIEIVRNMEAGRKGAPFVSVNGQRVPVDISLSHDGRYVAYAFTST